MFSLADFPLLTLYAEPAHSSSVEGSDAVTRQRQPGEELGDWSACTSATWLQVAQWVRTRGGLQIWWWVIVGWGSVLCKHVAAYMWRNKMKYTYSNDCQVSIGLVNVLVSSGSKLLPEPMLKKFRYAICGITRN